MKKFTLPILGTLALTLSSTSVFAVDGTITVNGVITDGTCTLQGSEGPVSGVKDLTVNLPARPKSNFFQLTELIMQLTNAAGTGPCDAATTKAFKGIHLSVASPTLDLDEYDKSLLVNKAEGAGGASAKNPVFIMFTTDTNIVVFFSAPWERQFRSPVYTAGGGTYINYRVTYFSKTRIVDAQNVQATVNYTLHYN